MEGQRRPGIVPSARAIVSTLPSDGWLTAAEAELLLRAASTTRGDMLEVGSYQGRSTVLLASLKRTLHCVDPWDDSFNTEVPGDVSFKKFIANLAERGITNVVPYRMHIADWPLREVSFAYLDGDHTYSGTLEQVRVAVDCGAVVIAVHDTHDPQVSRACEEMLGRPHEVVETMAVWNV